MTKIPSVEAFWKMLEANQFVKTTNSITDKVEEHPPAIQDMEAIVAIHGEFDKYAIDDWLAKALTAERTALLTELREWADSRIKPQKHGKDCLGEYCDRAFCNWDDIFHKNKEMELLKARINNLINPDGV